MFERSFARVNAFAALFVFAAAFGLHIDNLDNALLGWDSYATIIASRIESAADLWGTFSEVMMDGRFPFADFYRPVGNLFIAFDHAIWGLVPFGYQLTNLALWSLSVVLVFLLARRLLGEGAIWGPAIAVVVYILHPAILSILPYTARRTETLQIVFVLLALLSLPVSEGERRAPRHLLTGLFAALAVASKETGIIVLLLAFIHQFLTLGRTDVTGRAIAALRAVVPAGVLVAAVLSARFAVIGGMGGYHEAAPMGFVDRLVSFSPAYFQAVAVTGTPGRWTAASFIAIAIFLALASVVVWLYLTSRSWNEDQRWRVAGLGAVGVVWLLGQVGLACMSFQFAPRYLLGMVIGLSLIIAAVVEGMRITRTFRTTASRSLTAFAAASMVVAMLSGLAGSPLWYDYPGFAEASRIQENEIRALTDGMRTRPLQRPTTITVRRQVPIMDDAVDHAWMLSPWGLQAWLDMSFPDKPMRVGPNRNVGPSQSHWNLVLFPDQDR
jgi:hypothetical protein